MTRTKAAAAAALLTLLAGTAAAVPGEAAAVTVGTMGLAALILFLSASILHLITSPQEETTTAGTYATLVDDR